MAVEPITLPEADQEIADAYHWLERRGLGLGKDFLRCLDAALATICQMPEGFAKKWMISDTSKCAGSLIRFTMNTRMMWSSFMRSSTVPGIQSDFDRLFG